METIEFGTNEYFDYKHNVLVEETVKGILMEHIGRVNSGDSMPSDNWYYKADNIVMNALYGIIVTSDYGTDDHEEQRRTYSMECYEVFGEAMRKADIRWENGLFAMGLID